MYSEQDAIRKALKLSRKNMRPYFVVYSPNENDVPGNDYHAVSDYDLECWFCGCQVLFATDDYYANT